MAWKSVTTPPPLQGGALSDPVWVAAKEFGQGWVYAVARAWRSSLPEQPVKWYLDAGFYRLERPYEIAQTVYFWDDLPELPAEAANIP